MSDRWKVRRVAAFGVDGVGDWIARRAAALGKHWHVETPMGFPGPSFPTHAEAIDAAQRLARDPDGGLRMEVGT